VAKNLVSNLSNKRSNNRRIVHAAQLHCENLLSGRLAIRALPARHHAVQIVVAATLTVQARADSPDFVAFNLGFGLRKGCAGQGQEQDTAST
jgi:hypothetical protein